MRTKPFTFKKTKRIKQVTEHHAISVDLTVQEAADLAEVVGSVEGFQFDALYRALNNFVSEHDGAPSFSVPKTIQLRMARTK